MVQDHTTKIDNIEFYAQGVTMPRLFKSRDPVEVPIEEGDPIWLFGSMKLREFTFQTIMYGKHEISLDIIKGIVNKVTRFTSIYIGSFNAIVTIEGNIEDGVENVLYVKFKVQEVV
jgi:hypothetical protein